MTYKQRMAKAWVNLNCLRWDEFIGEKPDGWDEMPEFCTTGLSRYDIIHTHYIDLGIELGEKATSRAWWKYELNRSWLRWFVYWHFTRRRDYR